MKFKEGAIAYGAGILTAGVLSAGAGFHFISESNKTERSLLNENSEIQAKMGEIMEAHLANQLVLNPLDCKDRRSTPEISTYLPPGKIISIYGVNISRAGEGFKVETLDGNISFQDSVGITSVDGTIRYSVRRSKLLPGERELDPTAVIVKGECLDVLP